MNIIIENHREMVELASYIRHYGDHDVANKMFTIIEIFSPKQIENMKFVYAKNDGIYSLDMAKEMGHINFRPITELISNEFRVTRLQLLEAKETLNLDSFNVVVNGYLMENLNARDNDLITLRKKSFDPFQRGVLNMLHECFNPIKNRNVW